MLAAIDPATHFTVTIPPHRFTRNWSPGQFDPAADPVSGVAPSSFAQFCILLSSKHQEDSTPAYADTMLDRLAAFQIVERASMFGQLQDLIRRAERERTRQWGLEVFLKELTVPTAA